jgi:hypothetical protein
MQQIFIKILRGLNFAQGLWSLWVFSANYLMRVDFGFKKFAIRSSQGVKFILLNRGNALFGQK